MLYSQALSGGGGHQAAPSSSSSSPISPGTTKTTTATPKETTTKEQHSPPRRHQHQPRHPPNPDHTPNTPANHHPQDQTQAQTQTQAQEQDQQVYVLTLTTTPSLSTPLTALRRRHFPPHRDRGSLPAHLTLFHALPASEMEGHILPALEDQQKNEGPVLKLATGKIFRMRRGVGIELARGDEAGAGARAARRLHAELQRRWWPFLSAQDRQPWRPHWTVQNKAADDAAVDAAMEDVRTGFRGAEGLATGCTLWRYEKGGRWTFERAFDFGGDK